MLFVRNIFLKVIISNHSATNRENNMLDVRGLTSNEAEREVRKELEEAYLRNGK